MRNSSGNIVLIVMAAMSTLLVIASFVVVNHGQMPQMEMATTNTAITAANQSQL